MRKPRSESIQPVLTLAEQAELRAARQMADCQRYYQQALAKRDELLGYHRDYRQRGIEATCGAFHPAQLRDQRAFLQRLQDIIRLQETIVEQQAQRLAKARQQWLRSQQQAGALNRLQTQYHDQERRERQRREQFASDELNGLRHAWRQQQDDSPT